MAHKTNFLVRVSVSRYGQKGAVLIFLAFVIGLGAAAYLLKEFNVASLQVNQDKKTYKILGEAKQALIAWSVSHANRPGQMPFPDRNADGDYDGNSDCNSPASTFSYAFLLGQLPIYGQKNPCVSPQVGIGGDFHDAQGNRLWYAISRNLVHKYESPSADPIINPSIINDPVYPWLRVLDRNGALISDRVAAVIIAPGSPIGAQNRSSATPNPSEFLDTFQIGATIYSNANYDTPNEDFIISQDSRNVADVDATYVKPYAFNDQLVFITIDELITALNYRVAAEAKSLLNQYNIKNSHYPYAADLGSALNNHVSSGINTKGMLPIDVTDNCSCTSATSCSCSFKPIASVALERESGTWNTTQDSGSCSSANGAPSDTCTCTGAGSCTRFGTTFVCDSLGVCTHNLSGSNKFIYTVPDYADIYSFSVGCVRFDNQVDCNDAGSFSIGLKEPPWFKPNLWQDYLYYEWSAVSNLQLGFKSGLTAILINTGDVKTSEIGWPQSRPSSDIRDYLDSMENTNNDSAFDAANKRKTNNYNDQPFVVAP